MSTSTDGATDTVQLWLIDLGLSPVTIGHLESVLDDGERERAGSLPEHQRRRFVGAHGATRTILGRHLDTPPERLRWNRGPHGKPELTGEWTGVQVNLSHSADLALLAITHRRRVGVDIQSLPVRLDAIGMSTRFFARAEARFVASADGSAEQIARFTRLWTRKEACVKATGGRLAQGTAIPVHSTGRPGTAGLLVHDPGGSMPGPYRVRDVSAPHGFLAAVALEGTDRYRLVRGRWADGRSGTPEAP